MKSLRNFESFNFNVITDSLMQNNFEEVSKYLKNNINDINKFGIDNLLQKQQLSHLSMFMYSIINLCDESILSLLLEYGSDINYKSDVNGYTSLLYTASRIYYSMEYYGVITFLINNGADWNIQSNSGFDFLDIIGNDLYIKSIIDSYPDKYKKYLIKKEANKYNL